MVKVTYREIGENAFLYAAFDGKRPIGQGISSIKPEFDAEKGEVITSGLTFKNVTSCREC